MRPSAFAIPGDFLRTSGGYLYERELLAALRATGRPVALVATPGTMPLPPEADMATTIAALVAVPEDVPLIVDGLIYGGIDTEGLAAVKAPIVAMIHHPLGHETGLDPAIATFLLAREKANLALADHVVVPSPHTAQLLAAEFDVPPGRISIALPGFAPPDPVRTPVAPPLILSVGLMARRKGHDVLLRALSRITDLAWQAEIIGAPHEQAVADELVALRGALGLGERVVLAGAVDDAVRETRYRQASIFALATRFEGYGIVFGEAMLHGLPIVTCRTGAVPDTVPDDAGLLVPVDDDAAFADALRALLVDHVRRAGMAAASTAHGARLPRWADTAAVMGGVLDRVSKRI